jgi:hypothetical protein
MYRVVGSALLLDVGSQDGQRRTSDRACEEPDHSRLARQ